MRLILPGTLQQSRGLTALHHTGKERQLEVALTGRETAICSLGAPLPQLTVLVSAPSEGSIGWQ